MNLDEADRGMEIVLNGAPRAVRGGATIAQLLAELNLDTRHCAVECNLQLVPRAEHAAYVLHSGDKLEVVTLVGGG